MNILVIQNRMGIGDMVIFLPFIEAISKKLNTPVKILVKQNSKSREFLNENKNISEIIDLERDNKIKGKHDGFFGTLKLIEELKKHKFDEAFIFNSSLRFFVICKLAKIKKVYQYPLFEKKNQHIIKTAKQFLNKKLNLNVESKPEINLNINKINQAKQKYNFSSSQINILLGIGGSGKTKRIPAETFIKFIDHCSNFKDCRFFLATGNHEEELVILNKILGSTNARKCEKLNHLKISETLPIIKNCNIAICNDSSFSHLSAALNIPTIVLMADTPLLYGNYNPMMHPIIPDGEETVKHDTLGKDKINSEKIFEKFKTILF
tara:strand:+ start:1385 stop:2347 length:963 start_codon:yes stop_codon:yes gene_type:complete